MQLVRYVPIQRIEDFKQRGVVPVAVEPFFVGERHHQVRFALKTVDCGIGPAVTDALKYDGALCRAHHIALVLNKPSQALTKPCK